MARPQRPSRQRVEMLPQVPLPPGQPAPPNVGPPAPPTTRPPTARPATTLPTSTTMPTSTTLPPVSPPNTAPQNTGVVPRTPEALGQMAAFADELANVLVVQYQDVLTYTSQPLGFESATTQVRVPATVAKQGSDGQLVRDASGQIVMVQASGPGGPMFDNIYELDARFLPPDPWLLAAKRVAQEVMSSTSTNQFEFLETPAAQLMAQLGARPATTFRLATEQSVDQSFITMSLDELNEVKLGLLQTGLIKVQDLGDPTSKGVSTRIRDAAFDAARLANFDGMDWQQFLQFKASTGAVLGVEATTMGTQRAMPTIRVTSDADLRYVLNDTAIKFLGRELGENELAPMVGGIQQEQEQFQRQSFAQEGGVMEEPSSLGVSAQERIRTELSDEYDVYQMGNVMDSFRSILAGQR